MEQAYTMDNLRKFPNFEVGDIVRVRVIVPENQRRIDQIDGFVDRKIVRGMSSKFTISTYFPTLGFIQNGFHYYSPNIVSIQVLYQRPFKFGRMLQVGPFNSREMFQEYHKLPNQYVVDQNNIKRLKGINAMIYQRYVLPKIQEGKEQQQQLEQDKMIQEMLEDDKHRENKQRQNRLQSTQENQASNSMHSDHEIPEKQLDEQQDTTSQQSQQSEYSTQTKLEQQSLQALRPVQSEQEKQEMQQIQQNIDNLSSQLENKQLGEEKLKAIYASLLRERLRQRMRSQEFIKRLRQTQVFRQELVEDTIVDIGEDQPSVEFNIDDYYEIVDPYGYSLHDDSKGDRNWDLMPDGRLIFWETPNRSPGFLWPGVQLDLSRPLLPKHDYEAPNISAQERWLRWHKRNFYLFKLTQRHFNPTMQTPHRHEDTHFTEYLAEETDDTYLDDVN